MQNYEQFMKELSIEIPEDKKDALSAKMKENLQTFIETMASLTLIKEN